MEVDNTILNDILTELKIIREKVEHIEGENLKESFICEILEFDKEKSLEFKSIEDLNNLVKNA